MNQIEDRETTRLSSNDGLQVIDKTEFESIKSSLRQAASLVSPMEHPSHKAVPAKSIKEKRGAKIASKVGG